MAVRDSKASFFKNSLQKYIGREEKMKGEEVKYFLRRKVKLVTDTQFVLYGEIAEVYEDSLLFKSDTTISIIDYNAIRTIVARNGD